MNECEVCANDGNKYCFACDNGNQFKPMTNVARFRAMTDEELAAYIDEHTADAIWCNNPPFDCPPDEKCVDCILNWLRREATE